MQSTENLLAIVRGALEEIKAIDLNLLDVRDKTSITDYMWIASGSSERHVKSVAENVVRRCKEAGLRPLGVEGERAGEWVLVDLGEIVVHVMLPRVREFYQLEKLWTAELGEEDPGALQAGLPQRRGS